MFSTATLVSLCDGTTFRSHNVVVWVLLSELVQQVIIVHVVYVLLDHLAARVLVLHQACLVKDSIHIGVRVGSCLLMKRHLCVILTCVEMLQMPWLAID